MKKIISFALVLILLFSGCVSNEPPESPKTPEPPELPWEYNLEEHWKTDENGEKTEFGKHMFDNYHNCSVCKSQFYDFNDGRFSVSSFDENGKLSSSKYFENGELVSETEYAVNSDGNEIPVRTVYIHEDGNKIDSKLNEFGETSENVCYSPEGEILFENYYEYTFLEDGTYYLSFERYLDYKETRIFEYTYNKDGDWLSYTVYRLDTNSFVYGQIYEYEYDSEGRKIYRRALENGDIREEFFYEYYEDEEGLQSYCSKYIHYINDQHVKGHYTVTEYDKNGNVVSDSSYDSLGNKLS